MAARHLRSGLDIQWSQYPGVDEEYLTEAQQRERFALTHSGLVFSGYRPMYWHFEVTNCFTKLALLCVVQFIDPGSVAQILATLALALVSVLLYSILHPMGSLLAQSWKVVFSILLFVNLFLGFGMHNGSIDAADLAWGWALLLLNVLTVFVPVLLGGCLFVYAGLLQWRATSRAQQKRSLRRSSRISSGNSLTGEEQEGTTAPDDGVIASESDEEDDDEGLQGDELAF